MVSRAKFPTGEGFLEESISVCEDNVPYWILAGGFFMKEKVEQALAKIRPALQRDGGDVELVEVAEDGLVKVRLTGACRGCPMSQMTLKAGVERILKQQVPEITSVVAV
jgi:Fe-S cluster biogenesis protein NfuA